jgi:hypothetical protein
MLEFVPRSEEEKLMEKLEKRKQELILEELEYLQKFERAKAKGKRCCHASQVPAA